MGKIVIQLGKTGDILNLLPLLRAESDNGNRCGLMVAEEFAPVLDGVGYVDRHVYPGPYHEVGNACEQAKHINGEWVCTQVNCSTEAVIEYVYGPAGQKTAVTTSFQKESWRVADKLAAWDSQPELLFDKRSKKREAALLDQWAPHSPKVGLVLVSTGGVTSPFPYANVVRELIRAKFQAKNKWHIVDLAEVKAERIYDLLALYERAHCLIATDSAPLHLARACPKLPVLAFANDKPLLWNGSPWRPNHTFYCRYGDFLDRVGHFVWALDNINGVGFRAATSPRIVHVWSEYEGVSRWPDWFTEYKTGAWEMTPIEVGACGRDSKLNLGDPRRMPYLKDCLRMGMQRAQDDDFVCLTRPDTRFCELLTYVLLNNERTFAYRMNQTGGRRTFQPVADLFCARKSWWREILPEIPDMIFGRDVFWPHALWALFDRAKAHDATGMIYREKA